MLDEKVTTISRIKVVYNGYVYYIARDTMSQSNSCSVLSFVICTGAVAVASTITKQWKLKAF